MIKKVIVYFLLSFFLFSGRAVFAQDKTTTGDEISPVPEIYTIEGEFDSYYKDYISKMEEYQNGHQDYVFRKSQYQRFGTLKSQQDAFDATAKMIQTRDDVIIAYLFCLKARLKELTRASENQINSLNIRLDDEIGWFSDHKNNVPSAGTLDDLIKDSDEANKRWTTANGLVYEILSTVAQGENLEFAKRVDESFFKVKSKLSEVRSDTREGYSFSENKFQTLDRWVFEIDSKLTRSKEKQTEAEDMINQFVKLKKDYLSNYNKTVTVVEESQLYLKEASTYLREIINELKKAED